MLETNWDLTTDLKTVVGFGQTWISKGSHDVSVDVGYAALTKKQQDWSYGLRLSIWNPKGYSKNRLDLPKPLFFNAEEPVQEFTRIQASLRYDLNLTQFVSCELAYDRASKTDDVTTTGCFYTVQVF